MSARQAQGGGSEEQRSPASHVDEKAACRTMVETAQACHEEYCALAFDGVTAGATVHDERGGPRMAGVRQYDGHCSSCRTVADMRSSCLVGVCYDECLWSASEWTMSVGNAPHGRAEPPISNPTSAWASFKL